MRGSGVNLRESKHRQTVSNTVSQAYRPVDSSLVDFGRPAVTAFWFFFRLHFQLVRYLRSPSAWPCRRPRSCRCGGWRCLRWSNAPRCCRPCSPGSWRGRWFIFSIVHTTISSSYNETCLPTHPFLLFLYTLAILSVGTPYFSDIYKRQVLANGCEAANGSFKTSKCRHLQHPSILWVWETWASVRQTPRPSPFERTTALWRNEEEE